MRTDLTRALIAACLATAPAGCGAGGPGPEWTGPEMRSRLPREVADAVPADAVLCLDHEGEGGAYRVWLLRKPGGTWLDLSTKGRKADSHELPASALLGVFRSRLPSLALGAPPGSRCRFTHRRLPGGAEIQIRELITDQGWFASVERVAM